MNVRKLVMIACTLFVAHELLFSPQQAAVAVETEPVPVGVAKIDITPEHPVRMYGYSRRVTESEGVAGPLKASALAIGDHQEPGPVVLLTVDNGSTPCNLRDEVFRRVTQECKIRPERFVLANSHNHSGPNLKGMKAMEGNEREHMEKYAKQLTDKLVEVVLQALAAREPGHLAWTQGQVGFAINRRVLEDGKWTGFGEAPDAPVDHSLPVLRVTDIEGNVRAVVVNYSCHNTTLDGKFMQIHGDWAGCAQEMIETAHPGVTSLITIGCGADSNPSPRGTVELCEQHGRELADEVTRLLKEGDWEPLSGKIAAEMTVLEIPYLDPPEGEATPVELTPSGGAPVAEDLESETFQINTWTFGDKLAMVFLSDEVVVDYALRLKSELGADRLWISAYSNEVSRYIVTERLIQEGGYEVRNSLSTRLTYGAPEKLAPSMEDRIVGAVKRMLPDDFGNQGGD